jgi:hypothetical protein
MAVKLVSTRYSQSGKPTTTANLSEDSVLVVLFAQLDYPAAFSAKMPTAELAKNH